MNRTTHDSNKHYRNTTSNKKCGIKKSTTSLIRNSQITFVYAICRELCGKNWKDRCKFWWWWCYCYCYSYATCQTCAITLHICLHIFICIYNTTWCVCVCVCLFLLLLAPFLIISYANEKKERMNEWKIFLLPCCLCGRVLVLRDLSFRFGVGYGYMHYTHYRTHTCFDSLNLIMNSSTSSYLFTFIFKLLGFFLFFIKLFFDSCCLCSGF